MRPTTKNQMKSKKKQIDAKNLTYIGITTYPKLEQGTIHRFRKYRSNDNRYYVICDETLYNEDGILCQCNMEFKREDNFTSWLFNNTHICKAGKPVTTSNLHNYAIKDNGKDGLDRITEGYLYTQMALFTGMKNLPLDLLCSEQFHQLAIDFITYGLEIAGDRRAEEKANQSFNKINREKLRHIMTSEAFKHHRSILNQFSQVPFCCVAMDEGKTSGHMNFHFVLECPQTTLKSYPFNIVRMKGGNTDCYLEAIPKGLLPLSIVNINIGSVVIDGNTAQKKAWKSTSLILNTIISHISRIIVVPCLCHRTHNAYKRIAKNNLELSQIVNELHSLSKLCIEKQKDIGSICPQHMDTRWANDYDIVKFVIDHKDKIFRIKPNMSIEKFIDLEKVLKVFKCLISRFENPKTLFSSAFLILERAIGCLYELAAKLKVPFGRDLAESLSKYTFEAIDGGIWSLGYVFTPQGREDFRKRAIEQRNPREDTYMHYFNLENYPQFDDEIDLSLVQLPEEEEVIMTSTGELVENENLQSNDDDSNSSDQEETESDDDEDFIPADVALFNKNHLDSAKECLITLLKRRKMTASEQTYTINAFNRYIDSIEDPYKKYWLNESNYSWLQIRNSDKEMNHAADIAMRLLGSALSEASCERAISKQPLIHTNRRLRSNEDLLDARRILQSI